VEPLPDAQTRPALGIRPGGPDDVDVLLALFDEAVAWMVARGQPEQWGSRPFSSQPQRVERVRGLARKELWIAEWDAEPVGALAIGSDAPAYVPPAPEPETYVHLLLTSRRRAGLGIGSALLDLARERAREAGTGLLRVDCWAGAQGRLVAYYARNGFTPTGTFAVGDWPGQVLEQRLTGVRAFSSS
jgi:GNAT superfamily N-acetyltransferase